MVCLALLGTRARGASWKGGPSRSEGMTRDLAEPTRMVCLALLGTRARGAPWNEGLSRGEGMTRGLAEPTRMVCLALLGTRARGAPWNGGPSRGDGMTRGLGEPTTMVCLALLGTKARGAPWNGGPSRGEGMTRGLDEPIEVMNQRPAGTRVIRGSWGSRAGLPEPPGLGVARWATRVSLSVATVGAATVKRHMGCRMGGCIEVIMESCLRDSMGPSIGGCMAEVMTWGVLLVCQVASCSCGCCTYVLRLNRTKCAAWCCRPMAWDKATTQQNIIAGSGQVEKPMRVVEYLMQKWG